MTGRTRRDALWLAGGMGAAAALAQWAKPVSRSTDDAPSLDLDRIVPERFGAWRVDEAMRAFVGAADRQGRRVRFYDQVLERSFIDSAGQRIMLSIAFGGEQSASMQLHRPDVCYRASGYKVRGAHGAVLTLTDRPVPVTRLEAELPGRYEPVTYWTVLGGAVAADADSFRWRRLTFALRRQLLEGLLVRLSSIDTDVAGAFRQHARFAEDLMRALAPAHRDRLIGPPVA